MESGGAELRGEGAPDVSVAGWLVVVGECSDGVVFAEVIVFGKVDVVVGVVGPPVFLEFAD